MSHARGSSSENIPRSSNPAVGVVEPRGRSQTAEPAPRRAEPAPHARRAGHASAQRTDIVRVEKRPHRGYVAVGVEQVEDAFAEHRVLQRKLEAMVSKELKAEVRFEQVKSQLRRAGRTFAQGSLPFEPSDHHSDQHYLDQRGIVRVRRGSREATVSVRYDELQAALVRLSMTRAELEKATFRERELRINIEQAENQLRRVGIRPSQGLLPSTAPTTRGSSR
ncbi:PREDICTED: uncharacterized protein LOC104771983 [Camelina sativa]|uniref:Uncharacterized protein LOC104771983 n=1 Tax=Camelina sativa TaxID=90675 RepID=A0ABM0Y3M3_CAMSA|nr:PREDICTED: uncharacterized protein LOC104771983 [Camelina sativa]